MSTTRSLKVAMQYAASEAPSPRYPHPPLVFFSRTFVSRAELAASLHRHQELHGARARDLLPLRLPRRGGVPPRPSPTSSRPRKGCRPCASTTRPSPSLKCSLRSDDMISWLEISTASRAPGAVARRPRARRYSFRRARTCHRKIGRSQDSERALISHTCGGDLGIVAHRGPDY